MTMASVARAADSAQGSVSAALSVARPRERFASGRSSIDSAANLSLRKLSYAAERAADAVQIRA
ncbi:hypothetical protein T492DRAFT_889189 [Pavlovales sp. CCMP2436]|nr:hypothetical protein T492DRAFT_889189 [Pavlovales sp. CCMP2436]